MPLLSKRFLLCLCSVTILTVIFILVPLRNAAFAQTAKPLSAFWVDTSGDVLFTEDTLQFIVEKSPDYLVFSGRLQSEMSFYNYENVITRLKQFNPNLKVIGYAWFTKAYDTANGYPRIGGFFWPYVAGQNDFFLHDKEGNKITHPLDSDFYLMNIANPSYQAAFLQGLTDFYARFPQLDGIILDRTLYYPPGEYTDIYGQDNFYNNYHNYIKEMYQRIKEEFPDKLLFFNGLSMDHDRGSGNIPAAEYLEVTDGASIEFFCSYMNYAPLDFSANIKPYLQVMRAQPDKILLAYGRTGLSQPSKRELAVENYCLASFLLGQNQNSYFKFHRSFQTRHITDKDRSGLAYYDNQDLDLGNSLGFYFIENGVYQRKFEKGLVLVAPNDLESPASVSLDRDYYDLNGSFYSADSSLTLSPAASFILITSRPCNNNGICENVENINSCGKDCNVVVRHDFETPPKYQLPFQLDVGDESVSREYSEELQSNVIKVDYTKADTSKWYQKQHFLKLDRLYQTAPPHQISFKLKTTDPNLVLRFFLHADDGAVESEHFPLLVFVPGSREYVSNPAPGIARIGLGENITSGGWQTISLNLNDELRRVVAFGSYTIHKVDTLSIQGSFEMDDVILSYSPVCAEAADLNCDGASNILDLLHWRLLFAQAKPEADVNGGGQRNLLDYLSVLRGWLD